MAVALRMARHGSKKKPFYRLVATDSRNKRDGSFLAQIGIYCPLGKSWLEIERELAETWLARGAQPSATVRRLLRRAGVTFPGQPAATPAAS